DLDADLGDEVDHVGRASIDLLLSAGTAEPLDLIDGHPLNTHLAKTILHIVQLEWLDDGFDLLHAVLTLSRQCFAPVSQQLNRRNPRSSRLFTAPATPRRAP